MPKICEIYQRLEDSESGKQFGISWWGGWRMECWQCDAMFYVASGVARGWRLWVCVEVMLVAMLHVTSKMVCIVMVRAF